MIRVYELVRVSGTTEEIYELTLDGAEFRDEDHYIDHISWDLDGRILSQSDDEDEVAIHHSLTTHLHGRIHCLDGGRIEVIGYQSWGGVEYRPVVIFDVQ